MANVSSPCGLRPIMGLGGGRFTSSVQQCFVPATDGTALYIGDPVIFKGTASADGYPTVGIASAGGGAYVSGVVVGISPDPLFPTTLYRAASTARYLLVEVGNVVFEIEEDGIGGALGLAGVSSNADLISGSGSAVTGLSGWLLDSSTSTTTNTLQLRVYGFVDRIGNDPTLVSAKVQVLINLRSYANTTGI